METFKTLLGNRVYLEVPKKEKSPIIVDENTKQAVEKEFLKKMRKLKVLAIGEGCKTSTVGNGEYYPILKVDDYVLVDPEALSRKATIVPLSDDEEVLMVSYFDIIHIW